VRPLDFQDMPSHLNSSVYGLGQYNSMQDYNDGGSDVDDSSLSTASSTNHKHPRSITPSNSQKEFSSLTSSASEKENKIRIVEKLGFMTSSLRNSNIVVSGGGSKSSAPISEVSNKLRNLTNPSFVKAFDDDINNYHSINSANNHTTLNLSSSSNEQFRFHTSTGKFTNPLENTTMVVNFSNSEIDESIDSVAKRERAGSWNVDANIDFEDWLDDNQLSNLTIPELVNDFFFIFN